MNTLAVIWRPIGPNGRTVVDSIHSDKWTGFTTITANEQAVAKYDAIKNLPGVACAAIVDVRNLTTVTDIVVEHGRMIYYHSNVPNTAPINAAVSGLINSLSADWF